MSFIIKPNESADIIIKNWDAYISAYTKCSTIFSRAIRGMPTIIGLLKDNNIEHSTVISLFEAVTLKLKRAPKLSSLWNATYARICYEFNIKSLVLDVVLSRICPLYNTVNENLSTQYQLESSSGRIWQQFTLGLFRTFDVKDTEINQIKRLILPIMLKDINHVILEIRPFPIFFTQKCLPSVSTEVRLLSMFDPDLLTQLNDGALTSLYVNKEALLEWAKYSNDTQRVKVLINALEHISRLSDHMVSYFTKNYGSMLTPFDVYNCVEDKRLLGQLRLCVELGINDYSQIKELVKSSNDKIEDTSLPVFEMNY